MRIQKRFNFSRNYSLQVILTLLFVLLTCVSAASAQSPAGITLSKPDLSQYPYINLSFRAADADGQFVTDLQAEDITVVENNLRVSAESLELVNTGVRLVAAINEGPTLANRYSGVSRFDRVKAALFNWISSHGSTTLDEFSLFTNQGPLNIDTTDPKSWNQNVQDYQPDLRNLKPGLSSLTSAVDGIISAGSTSNKSSAVLFITPLPYSDQFKTLTEIFAKASQNGIRIFVWLIGPQEYAASKDAQELKTLTEQTGGSLFIFSGSEDLPDLAKILDPLENIYQLTYKTAINISGEYPLLIQINKGQLALESEPVTLTFQVAAPNPIFLSPPSEITRSWTEAKRKRESVLTPDTVNLKILVEFPDNMKRELAYSRLFVDNKLADENTTAPFDDFSWNISEITESGSHTLQVVIEDTVGLQGKTIEIPVDVAVLEKPMTLLERIFARVNIVNGIIGVTLILMVAGGILALIRFVRTKFRKPERKLRSDPVTQPVEINGEYTLEPIKPEQKIEWPVIRGVGLAPARLLRKTNLPQDVLQPQEIPLSGDEVVIGSDRKKADMILSHTSISGLHARIFKDADGNFRVADAGSNVGTWVNYAPVSSRGVRLEHGDLVQFGRIAYIFELHGAGPRHIQVLPYHED